MTSNRSHPKKTAQARHITGAAASRDLISRDVAADVVGYRLFAWILGHAKVVCAAFVLVTLFFAVQLPKLQMDTSVDIWFVESDPEMIAYDRFQAIFGRDVVIVAGVFHDDLFSADFLTGLAKFTEAVESEPNVAKVTSLKNVMVPVLDSEQQLNMEPLLSQLPKDRTESAGLRARVNESAIVRDGFLSQDGRGTAIIVLLDEGGSSIEAETAIVAALEKHSQLLAPGSEFHMAGTPVLNAAMFYKSNRDLLLTGPVGLTLVLGIGLLFFRRLTTAALPLGIVVVTIIWVLGLMSLLGIKLTIVGSPLILVLIVVGVAVSIHMITSFERRLSRGTPKAAAICQGMGHVLRACIFTSLTTIVGFLAMLVSYLSPMREFGMMAATGTAFALVISVGLLPIALLVLKPRPAAEVQELQEDRVARLLYQLGGWTQRLRWPIVSLALLLTVWAATTIPNLKPTFNPMYYLRPHDPVRMSAEKIDQQFGGSASLELLIETEKLGLTSEERLQKIEKLQAWIESFPGVTSSLSIVDILKEYQRLKTGDESLPTKWTGLILRRMAKNAPQEFASLVAKDMSVGRISARFKLSEADSLVQQVDQMEQRLGREFNDPTDLQVSGTGFAKLMSRTTTYIIDSQINSLAAASVTITVMMILLLKSVRLGLIAMIPNIVPIILGLACMSLCGILLNPATVMVATVAIGLVVDDTCHFCTELQENLSAGMPVPGAISTTLREVGRPIIATSLILAAGFSCLVVGSFIPTIHFGAITAVVVMLALVADLVMFPALISLAAPLLATKKEKETVDHVATQPIL